MPDSNDPGVSLQVFRSLSGCWRSEFWSENPRYFTWVFIASRNMSVLFDEDGEGVLFTWAACLGTTGGWGSPQLFNCDPLRLTQKFHLHPHWSSPKPPTASPCRCIT